MSVDTIRFYWLPFPGTYQCVVSDANGNVKAEALGATKLAAEVHAREQVER